MWPSERELGRTALELVAIPSVTGHEQALAAHLRTWARDRFAESRIKNWRSGMAVLPEPGDGPLVALVGHLDTVPPAPEQPLGLRDGRLYGCGASDMKAGVAVMMAALEGPSRHRLLGLFYDREEGDRADNGLVPLLELVPRPDLAVVLEPTANQVQIGCLGGLHALVRFRGRRAHSARPWQGDNAIYRAAPLLQRLRALKPREVRVQGHAFREVITATTASTGDNPRNAVPGEFVLNLNMRFAPGRDEASAKDELLEVVAGEGELEVIDTAPAGEVCLDHPLLRDWLQGTGLEVAAKQAWTDVAQLTSRGIPGVNFGPGEPSQAHQPGEWAEVAAMDRCLELLAKLL